MPGIPEDKISVELDDGALTITGERERKAEQNDDRFYRFERRHGTFTRTFGVPQGVTESDVTAEYKNGVLRVVLHKREEVKARRIEIAGEAADSQTPKTIEAKASEKGSATSAGK